MKTKDLLLVIIQCILLIIFMLIPSGFAKNIYFQLVAFLFTISGVIIFAAAILQLGQALTPLPTPRNAASLIVTGIYKYFRHPIYSGILLTCIGITIYSMNIPRLVVTVILYVFFHYKSRYEELLLREKYVEYSNYANITGRFLPKII